MIFNLHGFGKQNHHECALDFFAVVDAVQFMNPEKRSDGIREAVRDQSAFEKRRRIGNCIFEEMSQLIHRDLPTADLAAAKKHQEELVATNQATTDELTAKIHAKEQQIEDLKTLGSSDKK